MKIFGSVAACHWWFDFHTPNDLDLIQEEKISSKTVSSYWNPVFAHLDQHNVDPIFIDPNWLFTIKFSHAHWDVHWQKTMNDIVFMKAKGCVLDFPIYEWLFIECEKEHGPKKVNLKKPMTEFWNDAVVRKYDHEWLHSHLMFNEQPMHELIRPNLAEVWCNEDLFTKLDRKFQLEVAIEELMVTAVERFNLNSTSSKSDVLKAVNVSYKKLVTSMTTGWFARFLIHEYGTIWYGRKFWIEHFYQKLEALT